MMENGKGNEYRGKSLDEININLDELLSGEEEEDSAEENEENGENGTNLNQATPLQPTLNKSKSSRKDSLKQVSDNVKLAIKGAKKKKIIVVPWSDEDRAIVTSHFKKHIHLGKAPKKNECEQLMKLYPQINKHWKKIKDFVHNKINSQKKK